MLVKAIVTKKSSLINLLAKQLVYVKYISGIRHANLEYIQMMPSMIYNYVSYRPTTSFYTVSHTFSQREFRKWLSSYTDMKYVKRHGFVNIQ